MRKLYTPPLHLREAEIRATPVPRSITSKVEISKEAQEHATRVFRARMDARYEEKERN